MNPIRVDCNGGGGLPLPYISGKHTEFFFMGWDCGCPLEGVIRSNKLTYKGDGAVPGFWAGRVMGTASLKSNMLQHLTSMREEVLYNYF